MHRIVLGNTVFEGKNNAYLFTEGPTTFVDTGVFTPETHHQFASRLADHGVGFDDIERVFLTHYHADHSGLVSEIQRANDATVYAHSMDASLAGNDPAAWGHLFDTYQSMFDTWNMPQGEQNDLLAYLDTARSGYGDVATVEPFEDGDQFDLGERTLEVFHAPGHTAGLCCFVIDDGREVLTGDAVLPVYTPNIGGADVRVDAPLGKYLRTLRRFADRGFERAWPGHRDPIDDPASRAEDIIHHHEERALRVLRVLEERGVADTWTVSADLFGDLENIHVLHGPGEAHAHLEHLHDAGSIQRTDEGYTLTAETEARLVAHEGDRWDLCL